MSISISCSFWLTYHNQKVLMLISLLILWELISYRFVSTALDSTCVINDRRYSCNSASTSSSHRDHSTQTCKVLKRTNRTGHICHLKNICWNPYQLKFVYYRDSRAAPSWGYDLSLRNHTPHYDLQVSYLKITRDRGLYSPTGELPIIEVPGPLPVDAPFDKQPVHVYYDSFWAENYGHAIFDDVLPAYSLMHHFYLVTRSVQVLSLEDLARNLLKRRDKSLHARGHRFLEEFFGYISDLTPIEMLKHSHQYDLRSQGTQGMVAIDVHEDPSKFTCFSNLLVGHAVTGLHFDSGRVVHHFVDTILTHAASVSDLVREAVTKPMQRQLVVVILKRGRRRIVNVGSVINRIRRVFGVSVKAIDPAELSTMQQIAIAQQATVIITPEGGISFFCIFARPGATAIIPGHYDLEKQDVEHMEQFFWENFDPIHVMYYYPDNETELVFDKKRTPNRPLKSGEYRDYTSVKVNLDRFMSYVEGALHRAEHIFGLADGSYVARSVAAQR